MLTLPRLLLIVFAATLLALAVQGTATQAAPQTYVVNVATDDTIAPTCTPAECSFRKAIEAANANPGKDKITFSAAVFPPAGNTKITVFGLSSGLPLIDATQGIEIDATGANVTIDGSTLASEAHGLYFYSTGGMPVADVTVRNMKIDNFYWGLTVCGGGGMCTGADVNTINLQSLLVRNTDQNALRVLGKDVNDVTINQTTVEDSVDGIYVYGMATVDGVTITNSNGHDVSGAFSIDAMEMYNVNVSNNTVPGNASGVFLYGTDVMDSVTVEHNTMTVDVVGISLGGFGQGSNLRVAENMVNGTAITEEGITLGFEGSSFNNEIYLNQVTGVAAGSGIKVYSDGSSHTIVHENTVAGSGGDGIFIRSIPGKSPPEVLISRNATYNNGELGIDLQKPGEMPPGVTLNDAGDGDAGPNELLNYPVLMSDDSEFIYGNTCQNCDIEMFLADPDPSGYGEGILFLGTVQGNAGGQFALPICGLGLQPGYKVTATSNATALYLTSEFSPNFTITIASSDCPATPTPTASPTITPSPTASPSARKGDANCSGVVDLADLGAMLGKKADVPGAIPGGCTPNLDLDCVGGFTPIDILALALQQAGITYPLPGGCAPIG